MNLKKINQLTNEIILKSIEIGMIEASLNGKTLRSLLVKIICTQEERNVIQEHYEKRKRLLEAQIKHFTTQLQEL
jgi:hypothetical protein